MNDEFFNEAVQLDSPGIGGFAVTLDALMTQPTRAIWVGGSGNLSVQFIDGTTGTLVGVFGGTLLPIRVNKILSSGTTATNLLGLY